MPPATGWADRKRCARRLRLSSAPASADGVILVYADLSSRM
ncbi:MAG: hypothetical protein ACLVFA_10540 [Butyricicoccus sp.]